MSPESEQQIQNVLMNSGMFTPEQVTMAVVVLDPVLTGIEADRDEWVQAGTRLTETREALEKTIEDMQKQEAEGRPSPNLQKGEPSPFNDTPYMTIIPGRSPNKKVHSTLGLARGAISYRVTDYGNGSYHEMQLLEFKDNHWSILHTFPKGTRKKDIPWRKG